MPSRLAPALPFLVLTSPLAANLAPELVAPPPALAISAQAATASLDLGSHLRDPDVPGSAVRITVRIAAATHTIDVALLDDDAPLTVANFLAYVDSGRYAANFFHRSVPGFIIQNGGFRFLNDTTYDLVPAFATVPNEPGVSNVRGTLAMAKIGGDPNSATSQWFINLADNAGNLDSQNGGFTVFGRVLGAGMTVADQIAAVPRYNIGGVHPAWTDVPLTTNPFVLGLLSRSYFVETGIARVAPLSHVVTVDDPGLVAADVVDGVLRLTRLPGTGGATTVRLVSTDLEGATLATDISLTVAAAEPYAAWRALHFGAAGDTASAADTADPDGDGLPNLLEYAVGSAPLAASAPAATVGLSGGRLALTYTRIADPALTYTVEVAGEPGGPWTTLAVAGNPSTGAADVAGPVTVTDSEPLSAHPRRFLRLRVGRS